MLGRIGFRTSKQKADDRRRAWMLLDWDARTFAPAWLELASEAAPDLAEQARVLRDLPEIVDDASWAAAQSAIDTARNRAWTEHETQRTLAATHPGTTFAWDMAVEAADGALNSSRQLVVEWVNAQKRRAGGGAAWLRAINSVRELIGHAAQMVAWLAAWGSDGTDLEGQIGRALDPVVLALQQSGLDLIRRLEALSDDGASG